MPLEPIGELTRYARRNSFAIGYFESWNLESLQGVIDAAEQSRSPVIIGFNGEFLCRAERQAKERLSWYGALGKAAADSASVPCGFMFNECPDDEWVLRAVTSGFNLVMPVDSEARYEDYADYQQRVIEVTEYAHGYGVGVEAEIDKLPNGGNEKVVEVGSMAMDGAGSAVQSRPAQGTDPQRGASFVEATGIDLLAVSVGNVHIKLNGRIGLDLERLAAIQQAVSVPLVLHGGTGITDESLREAISLGIAKVNFGTYLKQRYLATIRKALGNNQNNPHALLGIGGPEDVMVKGRQAVCDAVLERIHLLSCNGKA